VRTSEHVLFDFDADWPARPAIDLQRMVQAVKRRAVLIVLFAAIVAIAVFAVSHMAPDRYRATARLIAPPSSLSVGGEPDDERALTTSLALARTPAVRARAARQVPGETAASVGDKITASVETGAAVIDIVATAGDPHRAVALADAVARAFVEQRVRQTQADVARTRARLTAQLDQLVPGPSTAAEAVAIRRRLGDLAATQASAASEVRLAEPAQLPSGPASPRPARNALAGFLLALVLATLAVVAREYRRPAGSDERKTGGLPLLARFPSTRRRLPAARRERASADEEEARRSLLSAVLLALPPGSRHVVLTTSPDRDERSAHVAEELARSLAQAGPRTLAFSADLGSSTLPRMLGSGGEPAVPSDVADYNYVVVDAPGLLTASEPWVLGRHADAVVLVHPDGISSDELAAAREALDRLGARVLGAVIAE
jgi:capsular polysaccharide biosynthesis protein